MSLKFLWEFRMSTLNIKIHHDSGRLVLAKWVYSNNHSDSNFFSGFISSDYFSNLIASMGYKKLLEHISREELELLPYEDPKKIIKSLMTSLKDEDYDNIIASDEETMDFISGLQLTKNIRKNIRVDNEALAIIKKEFILWSAGDKFNINENRGQLSLVSYLQESVKKIIDTSEFSDGIIEPDVEELYGLLSTSGICWEVNSRQTKISDISPYAVTIGGPLLTTKKAPWPQGKNGFSDPVCQIPTDFISFLTEYNGPEGMAQFFFSEEIFSRVIGQEEAISPPEAVIESIVRFRGDDEVFEILGLKPPKVHICEIPDYLIDSVSKFLNTPDFYLLSLLKTITAKIQYPHFMGSFRPVQYSPSPHMKCILALENPSDVNFGDGGSGQIFLGARGLFGLWAC